MNSLKDQIAIVTGASRGVGRSVSLMLADQGCKVVLAARTQQELDGLAEEIRGKGGRALPVAADVTKEEDVLRVIEQAIEEFGRLDILINNAGIGIYKPIDELSVDDYDAMMNTNMRSTFICSKYALAEMKKQEEGHIINVASVAGLKGLPFETGYCASKFAQVGFAQSLDFEARPHGVKVSSICPGGINTTFAFGTGRTPGDPAFEDFSTPKEVAEVIIFTLQQPKQSRIIEVFMRPMSEPI